MVKALVSGARMSLREMAGSNPASVVKLFFLRSFTHAGTIAVDDTALILLIQSLLLRTRHVVVLRATTRTTSANYYLAEGYG